MNKFSCILLILTTAVLCGSCEKDDLCTPDQAVTPRLVIEFKDLLNPLQNKAVDRIQVQEIGSSTFAPLNTDGSTTLSNTESISIPLRTDSSRTSYNLILTEDGVVNSDNIDFNYILGEAYVSRACGFRVVYNNLVAVQTVETTGNQWIERVIIVEDQVTNNTDVHVQILH
ncbi:DUF6452 family protein [Nonlabens sp.]|uniref:DUF6452 family protein n=1 Tax=Nonlabens sp. TaxID=1888209 RepID=UPI001BCD6928|nr:DUF6452 family protein [Nonlabens sp.]